VFPAPVLDIAAANARARTDAVQADLGLAVIGIAYEQLLTSSAAIQLEINTFGTWFGPLFDLPNFSGFGAQIRPTWFFTPQLEGPRHGPYVAPFFRGARVSAEVGEGGATGDGFGWSAGIFGGYAIPLGKHVDVRLGGGAQYMRYEVLRGSERTRLRTFFPALDLVVGWSF
jgi:hypothetical protein